MFADFHQNKCSQKFGNIYKKTPVLESLFKKVAGLEAGKYIATQVFSYVYCKIFKNSFFYRTNLVAASGIETFSLVRDTYNFNIYEDSMTQT